MKRAAVLLLVSVVARLAPAAPRLVEPSSGMASDDLIVVTQSVLDFGADASGARDSTKAIQDAIDACHKAEGGTVFLPAGRYRVEGTLNVPQSVNLRGEWLHPDRGGLGKGTILMAYAGRGTEKPDEGAFITVRGGGTVHDLSVWYPEQSAEAPVAYPATIRGQGHSTVYNVTLYNSWCGFWNNNCSSMLVRRFYGTVLNLGLHGAYAFDVPRIEHVGLSPKYWSGSGLPGAPKGKSLTKLQAYLQKHLVGIRSGEQDWGYWWDLDIDWCQKGLLVTAVYSDDFKLFNTGNVAAGNVRIRNAAVGIYLENPGYPGFMLTYGDISARVCPLYLGPKPDFSEVIARGVRPWYQSTASVLATGVTFRGGKYAVASAKDGPYAFNFGDCTFTDYSVAAVRSLAGNVTVTRSRFLSPKADAYEMGEKVAQLVLAGNVYKGPKDIKGFAADDPRLFRDENDVSVPAALPYAFDHVPRCKPNGKGFWNVMDFGAVRGNWRAAPDADSTVAFQRALDAAGAAKGGTVYVPSGTYRLDGGLRVPSGVELRGTFEGQHYGNATVLGSMLYAYGGKDREDGAPLVTLAPGAGFRGFSVYYPEQGWTDRKDAPENARVKRFPPTVRTAARSWVRDCALTGPWTAIDAMTEKCDGLEIADVSGAAFRTCLAIGHGTVGGTVRNFHFNYSGLTHQRNFPNKPVTKEQGEDLSDYTTREVRGLVLGDVRKVDFFSCFNINVARQLVLEKDPYTGGSFKGKMWGVAFDAAHNGVIGEAGCEAVIGLIASMGVFFRQGGGYYALTEPGFKGRIVFSNADVWSGASKIADVRGGSVTFSQLLSWCCYEAVAREKGELNVFASSYVGDHVRLDNPLSCVRWESGAKGAATANAECRQILTLDAAPSATVRLGVNGQKKR